MEAFFYAVDLRQLSSTYFPSTALLFAAVASNAAQGGNAGSVRGTVTDQSGAVIPGATVHLTNAVSGLDRSVTTDATGQFEIDNVPFNNYNVERLSVRLCLTEPKLHSSLRCRHEPEVDIAN